MSVHIETKLEITWVSPPHLVVLGQAWYGSIRFVHTVVYSVPCCAVPGLEGSVNGVLVLPKFLAEMSNYVTCLIGANINCQSISFGAFDIIMEY